MKKRIIAFLLCILTVFSAVCLLASCDTAFLSSSETTGLYFFPLPDGSYGVKAGTALYLESIALPIEHNGRKLTEILPGAFEGAYNLKSINIPGSVTAIGSDAFKDCTALTSVIMPASLASIGENAFSGCVSLTEIKFKGTEEQWNAVAKADGWNFNVKGCTVTFNYAGE